MALAAGAVNAWLRCCDVREHVELYGALKRLHTWHNTHITMIDAHSGGGSGGGDIDGSGGDGSGGDGGDSSPRPATAAVQWSELLMAARLDASRLADNDAILPLWHGSMRLYGEEVSRRLAIN